MNNSLSTVSNFDSAAVVETSLLALGAGMSAQRSRDVKNTYLFASLVAATRSNDKRIDENWFNHFLDAMRDCGWVIVTRSYERESLTQQSLKLSSAALDAVGAAASALAGGTALTAVLNTLADQALKGLPKDGKALELFKRNVGSKASATVGLAACKQTENGEVLMALGALQRMTRDDDVDVLFFEWDGTRSTTYKGHVALWFNDALYEHVRDTVEAKLGDRVVSRIADYEL